MKRILVGIATLVSMFTTGAGAADLAARPYTKAPPAVVEVYNWTGFYIGANVGYSWGRSDDSVLISRFATGFPLNAAAGRNDVNGAIGGGQIGYNWQLTNWLVGLEADIQASGERGSLGFTCLACADDGTNITSVVTQRLNWFGTVRGRAGFLVTPSILLYGTGGFAYGEVQTGGSITGNNIAGNPVTALFPGTSSTRTGWTAGAGIEGRITGNWTAKLEYLYMDLGSVSAGPIATTILVPVRTNAGASYTSSFTDNIVRVGVNYRFGGPVVARY